MGICNEQLRLLVIRPALQQLGQWSDTGENLLLATAAQESQLGFHLTSPHSKGLGIYQIRPTTHRLIWDKYLVHHPDLASQVRGLASQHEFLQHPHAELTTNLRYSTVIAWLIYRRHDKPLPDNSEPEVLAKYWQRYYQRNRDAQANRQSFIANYLRCVAPGSQANAA